MNVQEILSHRGMFTITYTQPAKVSRKVCKANGIDPDSLFVTTRVQFNMIKRVADWYANNGAPLKGGDSNYTPLEGGNEGLVETSDGNYLIRGVVLHSKIIASNIPAIEGIRLAPRKSDPSREGVKNFRSFRLDRIEITPS